MALRVDELIRLVREVSRHKKKTRLVLDYDGENFHAIFERIVLSTEEYTLLSERKNEAGKTLTK